MNTADIFTSLSYVIETAVAELSPAEIRELTLGSYLENMRSEELVAA